MRITRILSFVILLIIVLIFAYNNLSTVSIKFFGLSVSAPLFVVILVTLFAGFAGAYGYSELKGSGLARYSRKLRNALLNIGMGRYRRAEEDLKKLISREEVIPLYATALRELDESITLYYERYSLGIAETIVAESIYRQEIDRAIDLLERAVGKNPENLRAKRNLRSLYFIKGELHKAIDLQKEILKDAERDERKEEELILSEMVACSGNGEATASKRGSVCHYLAQISENGGKKAKKILNRAISEGIGNEVLRLSQEKGVLTPEILTFVTDNEESFNPMILGLLYLQVGRRDRLEDLKENLPEPIKLFIEEGDEIRGECFKELLRMIRVWRCQYCGAEAEMYSPVCYNCLHWNTLRVKGGI